MCDDHVVLLLPFFDILVHELPDFFCGLDSIYTWHVDVHDYESICFKSFTNPLLTLEDRVLATDCLVNCDLAHLLKEHLEDLDGEDGVIDDKHLGYTGLFLLVLLLLSQGRFASLLRCYSEFVAFESALLLEYP